METGPGASPHLGLDSLEIGEQSRFSGVHRLTEAGGPRWTSGSEAAGQLGIGTRPLGAASRSLSRVGWRFLQPFLLESDLGVKFALTDTSPAMLGYHLQVSWNRMRGRAAAASLGLQGQVDATQIQAALRGSGASGYAAVLRAFCN